MDIKYKARLSIWVVSSIFFVNIVNLQGTPFTDNSILLFVALVHWSC
jgi:hypothetical protein